MHYLVYKQMTMYLFLAHGSVSVRGHTATIELYSNAKGIFMCSLDGADFQKCMHKC